MPSLKPKTKLNKNIIITLVVTFQKPLQNVKEVMEKQWKLLNIKPSFRNVLTEKPISTFKRNKNEHEYPV